MKRDLTSMFDLTKDDIYNIFELSLKMKDALKKGVEHKILKDRTLAMIFEKPSLRTRVTFETGMTQLGGHAIYLAPSDIQLGKRESVADVAQNLSRWVDLVMARVFAHATVAGLAKHARVPVINGLCDLEHPCQILCDLLTVLEKRSDLEKTTIAFIGDGNNVCNSFVAASAILGFPMVACVPPGYEPNREYLKRAKRAAVLHDPNRAVADADIVYTDVWTSMGQEAETAKRKKTFLPYQINAALMKKAKKGALVMHCLPAHRGEEITDEVIDSPVSIVFDQAENRLHIQKGIMVFLAGQRS